VVHVTTDQVAAVILGAAGAADDRPAMRFHDGADWRSISYADLAQRVRLVAKALVDSGVEAGDRVGIFSPNRPEWTIADLAVLSVGAVTVPLYATSTAKQAEYVVNDAGISLLFVGEEAQYEKVLETMASTPYLRHLVVFDDRTALTDGSSEHFAELLARGATSSNDDEVERRLAATTSADVATVIYTSGTTGQPKGAVLTHANFLHQFQALDQRFNVGPEDVSLCFLPLSHVYERAWTFYVLKSGAENCYLLDPRAVAEAMAEVRPSVMVSVPRLYEKVHAGVVDRVERGSAVRAGLFRWALGVGGRYQRLAFAGSPVPPLLRAEHAVADRLVLAKIRDVVGGRKKVFAAGGAPLAQDIEEFFFAAGVLICQGYGLTETTAMLTCNYPRAFRFGSVGTPVLGTELRIAADGEIQVRGGNVMAGYFGKPDETAAAFDDGWFRTGDVGTIDADGFLFVTDRIKDLIVTSQGKNVAPQPLEALFGSDPYIEQLVIIGDRRKYLSALIEPAFPVLERYAAEHGIGVVPRAELVALPEIRALYDERIADLSRELAGYEQIKRYTLMPAEFTQESGELTPTMKLKRRLIEQRYADVIDAMYDDGA
jgi:long-chain acyl-CoA synthetase